MTSGKIKSLTPEQETQLVSFRKEWRAIGTRTGHDSECESIGRAAIVDAYKEVGVSPPVLILWAQSPLQALLIHWLLQQLLEKQATPTARQAKEDLSSDQLSGQLRDQLSDQLWDQLSGQLSDQLSGQLRDQLSDQLWDQLSGQLSDQLRDQLSDQLSGQLRDQLSGQLWDQLSGQLWDQLRDQLSDQLSGQLSGQLRDQLSGQLWDQLSGQLSDQLWDQLSGQLSDQLRDQLSDQLSGQLRDQLSGQLRDQLSGQLRDQLSGQLRDQLSGQLSDQLWDQLSGQLSDQLRDQLSDQLSDQLRGQLRGQLSGQTRGQLWQTFQQWWCFGQCETFWSCLYRFGIEIGVKVTEQQDRRLAIIERLSRAAFMCFSWSGVTILVQHPTVAQFDDRQRLHRIDGAALEFADGYGVYAVHGIRLAPELGAKMADGSLTAANVRDEANAEVRRVLVGVYNKGDTGRYLRDINAKVIHEDKDRLGLSRRLLRIEQPGDEPFVAIEVTNSTPEPDGQRKIYTFRCQPELRPLPIAGIRKEQGQPQEMTCLNAIASTYGYYGKDFELAVET